MWTIPLVAGLFGLLFGSFLNVCTLRWGREEKKSVVFPGSHCPKCEEPLRWYDNIPLLSWLALRGRCRHCSKPISVQYPLVELATGLIWAGSFASWGLSAEGVRGAVFLTLLLGISVTDAREKIIPHEFSLGGAAAGLGMSFLPGGLTAAQAFLGAAVGFGVFYLVGLSATVIIRRYWPQRMEDAGVDQALGGGDINMMAMVGAFVGAWGVALTTFLGSVFALMWVLAGGLVTLWSSGPLSDFMRQLVPFGVYLAAGGGIVYAFGDAILRWYLTSIVGLPM